jgi:Flp pilus assembly protein TadB
MSTELALVGAASLLVFVLAWPALLAAWRRRMTRESSDVATALELFAAEARRAPQCLEIDPALATRMARLRMPELGAFRLAPLLPNATPALVADAAARLALRLRRRIAFERKMLARTAPGRRRAAVAGALPLLVLLALLAGGAEFPIAALVCLTVAEGVGCWLLARIARVLP